MTTEFALNEQLLEKINSFSRKKLTEQEVYCFPVILCDNEIDRDGERFSVAALGKLAKLFIGKTGIFDHDAKGSNQSARIFDTAVMQDEKRITKAGEVYTCLTAKAYMVRTAGNADLIAEIDGGIKKEVSVSCSVKRKKCSVCGAIKCRHVKGQTYGGRICHTILDDPDDAYEWSFVAVPAQVGAGVSKSVCIEAADDTESTENIAEMAVREQLISDIMRKSWLGDPTVSLKGFREYLTTLTTEKLYKVKQDTDKAHENAVFDDSPCLTGTKAADRKDGNDSYNSYKI